MSECCIFALGLIKGSEKPVAILCTSGTAAANYTPAIAESQISRLPRCFNERQTA